ncbi:MAB_1171c family putative transporter [Streptomyces sp. NPDC093595]|uniref:MAB_1171c family putative transporter n=1 Tax=Streptomyces sp. NPDC093595 TaxID=3366045 RepID=UPI0038058801
MRLFDLVAVPPLWGFVLWKACGLRTAPRQARIMWTMWLLWAVAFTIGIPAVRRLIDAAVGKESFTNLPVHMLSLCAMCAFFEFIRDTTGDSDRGRARLRWVALGLAEAGLAAAFWATPLPDGEADLLTATRSPMITLYWMIFLGYVLLTVASAIRLCWRYGRHASPGPTRTSMQLLGLASCFGLVYVVHRLAYLAVAVVGWSEAGASGVAGTTQVLLACTLLLLVASVCWPSLADRVQRFRLHRQVRAVRPLWRLLTGVTPDVVLPLPAGLRKDIELVRYRCVIEIRDSALALSRHVWSQQRTTVRGLLVDAGLAGDELQATAEAALLLFAARAERAGLPSRSAEHALVRESCDLDAEAAWLAKVAAAVRTPAADTAAGLLLRGTGSGTPTAPRTPDRCP